jgi:hypothetical protein
MTTDTRNSNELCLHALEEFAFLEREGFAPTCETSAPYFTITYTAAVQPISLSIGAFLPRYEYFVSIDRSGQRIGLDEVASVLDPPSREVPDWTWAHSDSNVFRDRISYSAQLLQRHFFPLLHGFCEIQNLVVNARSKAVEFEQLRARSRAADDAFKAGRWADAFEIYRSLPSLTKLQQKRKEIAARRE